MKKKKLIALFMSVGLVLVLVLSGCTTTAEPEVVEKVVEKTVTVEVDKQYKALNPMGDFIPVETVGLAERIDTMDGKTIYVCQGEADPVIMPALWEAVQEKWPNTTWIYYDRSDFGPSRPGTGGTSTSTGQVEDPDILEKVDAVIRGIGW